MSLLVIGILIFSVVHYIPSLTPDVKTRLVSRLTENGYKGLFSLLLLASFGLMIGGWRSATPTFVYTPVESLRSMALILMLLAFLLLAISNRKSYLRRWIRHPQLTGVALWGFAHLLLNGDSRSVMLFGGMMVWAITEIVVISRRDGVWQKTDSPSWGYELGNLAIAALVVAIVLYAHPWLSGVAIHW